MPSFIPVSLLVVFQVTDNGVSVHMQKRRENGPLDGLLEFPGGKIQPNELPEVAAMREFSEEVEEISGSCKRFKMYKYDYNDRSVCLFVHIMRVEDKEFCKGSWVSLPPQFKEADWAGVVPAANLEIISDLTKELHENGINL